MSLDTFINRYPPAILALADGSIFSGYSIGAQGVTVGEVVFNTSMTGYQEIITDPSYSQQIVTLTYPHIGNAGVNPYDAESSQVHIAGLIVRDLSPIVSNWRSAKSLEVYLKQNGVIAMNGVDTRRLTRILRDKGTQNGCIMTGNPDKVEALARARSFSGLVNKDLAKVVSTDRILEWTEGSFNVKHGKFNVPKTVMYHVIAYDYGVKHQMLRLLVDRGCRVTLVPAETKPEQVLAYQPDGILFSNGPGDPAACDYAIQHIKILAEHNLPMLGICLGFQLLALAFGAKTLKMKFGHHGANHPVQNLQTRAVYITSQNHGFTVDDETFPGILEATHRSLFDGTLQGFKHRTKPILAFQGHPEASPGPKDMVGIFDQFVALMASKENSHAKTN